MRFGQEHGITRQGIGDMVPAMPFPVSQAIGMGDLSSDFSQFSSDLMAGNFSQALGVDTILGVQSWIWLTGGIILYMFMFGGGDYSRASRVGRSVRKARKAAVSEYYS